MATGLRDQAVKSAEPVPRADSGTLFAIELHAAEGYSSRLADVVRAAARELGIASSFRVAASRGFLIAGLESASQAEAAARELLAEPIVQRIVVREVREREGRRNPAVDPVVWHVLPRPGVTDPEAESALATMHLSGFPATAVRTFRRYEFAGLPAEALQTLRQRALLNESIERLVEGELAADSLAIGSTWTFERVVVPLRSADDGRLMQISRDGTLSLTLPEMLAIQAHYRGLDRDPTGIELETIAQTWSEHCSHKTLGGRVVYDGPDGYRVFGNMLRETIFAATKTIREQLGADDWCVSVFKDNAGVVKFDERHHVTFKVETHNRPSAIEPYGGANTGLGGVIRDTLGTGLGAKPVCSTDVFCFAPPDLLHEELPPGVLHPRRIMQGVVAGVRDYGNRMGIPTVNGAICFDARYVGNPMVFCGNVGLLPAGCEHKQAQPDDLIVVLGGRTGRDGIHGATFSSVELHDESVTVSSGAVQIGNAITEKMVADVLLQARDRRHFNAVTDCGAGGFSSAVGEMGEAIGAEVWLDRAPLKYSGLTATEIWISEAQERMVLAVPEAAWGELENLCQSEGVEATVIGRFKAGGELVLKYGAEEAGRVGMEFLHQGRPPVVRYATFRLPEFREPDLAGIRVSHADLLLQILAHPNVASKHWVIRQYDHEVQGGSVVKPLVGNRSDGPSDAAVVRPVLDSERAIAVACGIQTLIGDLDPGAMAAAAIDEAIRNVVAVGADPDRIGILDNFCWGYTDRPATLGTLVRAALACHDSAVAMQTPFVSGKDSLNNEFSYTAADGQRRTISIPPTLLISALGQVPNAGCCVTMDFKAAGNRIYLLGRTGTALGGSHALLVCGQHGAGRPPQVNHVEARAIYRGLHCAIQAGLVASCHDCSEGGLAVALAEMAIAGDLGASVDVSRMVAIEGEAPGELERLFAESCSRLVCEVAPADAPIFESALTGTPFTMIGTVLAAPQLEMLGGQMVLVELAIDELQAAWRGTLDWS